MNYEPNTLPVAINTVVFHDGDAKLPHMAMFVVGHRDDGLVETVYLDPEIRAVFEPKLGTVMAFPPAELHRPDDFGVVTQLQDRFVTLSIKPDLCTAVRRDGTTPQRPVPCDPIMLPVPAAIS